MELENKRFIRRQARANQRKLDITLRQLTNGLLTAEQRYAIIHRLNIKKQYRLRLCVKPIRISDLAAVIDQSGTLQILPYISACRDWRRKRMSPEKKKQRRCDLLTTMALFLGLVFTCRLWPLLLLMMLGVFTYAIWALVENERQRAVPSPPPLCQVGVGTDGRPPLFRRR